MKDFSEVELGHPVICTRTNRLMRVKEIDRSFTMKSGDVVVYPKPRLVGELINPPSHLKNKLYDLCNYWDWSAVHQPPVAINDGLAFKHRVV